MPKELEPNTSRIKPPAPLVQINLGVGIGGMNRSAATGGNNGSVNPWEEQPETDWSKVVAGQVYKKDPRKGGNGSGGRAGGSFGSGINCVKTRVVPVDDRIRVSLQFYGVDLSGARFMTSDRYRRPEGSDSAIYARLPGGIVAVLSTCEDVIDCQIESTAFRQARPICFYWKEFHIPELAGYNNRQMAVSVRENLVTLRYNKLP